MISIICGEDSVASREYFIELISNYRQKEYDIKSITLDDFKELKMSDGQPTNLFGFKQIYTIENLNRHLSRRKNPEFQVLLKNIDQSKEIVLLDWEDSVSSRDLKFDRLGTMKEFKPSQNVFKLLEACFPGNLASFNAILNQITTPRSEMFVYIMLVRHIRSLLLIKEGVVSSRLQPWQRQRLDRQVGQWRGDRLVSYYQKLLGVDFALKTGGNLFGVKRSLEMLSCYYIS